MMSNRGTFLLDDDGHLEERYCPICHRHRYVRRWADRLECMMGHTIEAAIPDPMEPDYAALAAEPEQALASLIDRQSAGL